MEELAAVIIVIFGCLLFFVGLFALIFWTDSLSCNAKWPDIEHRYQIIGGCQVKTKGNWIPSENYRVF